MSSEANNDAADTPANDLATKETSPSVDDAATPESAGLPSVIVDPALAPEAPTALPSVIVDPIMSVPPSIETASIAAPHVDAGDTGAREDDDGAWSAGTLSDHDADRFADSMRPSWDMPAADTEDSWSAANAFATTATQIPTGRAVAPSNDSDGLPPVVLKRSLDKRMITAGIGGLLLIALALWSMIDHKPEAPPAWEGTSTNAPATPSAPAPPSAPPPGTSPAASAPAAATPTPPVATPSVPPVTTTAAPAPLAPAPTEAPSAPVPTPTTPSPTTPKTVHVRISTTPSGAELKLDGERVPNPFDAWVTAGGAHKVVADASGYTQREWSITFDQDQTLSLVLKREEAKRPVRRTRRPAARAPQSKSRPRGAGFVTDNPY